MADQPSKAGSPAASERTEFAAERTVLANERTYAAWMRTGLTALVSGLAAWRFMREVLANWALLSLAAGLLAFAVFSFAAGAWRYMHMGKSLAEAEIPQIRPWLVGIASALLLAGALIALGTAFVVR